MNRPGKVAPRIRPAGFTLIEILVAMLILAIMSGLAYGTYREARISAERTETALKRTRQIEFGMRIMVQDFSQIVPRPIRDPLGQTRIPCLIGGTGDTDLVEMTRDGWSNTAGEQRSTLQRVSYQLVGTVLKRSYFTVLDPTSNDKPIVQNLLHGVTGVQIRYLDMNQNWSVQWPPAGLPQSEQWTYRPAAVEIIIKFKDWGRIRRLVEVAG
ncbi:MAG: type II secretion system minor pseudopilin GspJ [Steroidobacteraceae bacterium]|nr:type II secretion system minor pseudopilin GspJ [Steroidobacteraceae bacterium]